MLHEVPLRVIRFLTEEAPPTTTDDKVTLALISAGAVILSALIAGYFGTRGDRASRASRATDTAETERRVAELERRVVEAEWDAAHEEDERRNAERDRDHWHGRSEALSIALWRRRLDPTKFIKGDETDDVARF